MPKSPATREKGDYRNDPYDDADERREDGQAGLRDALRCLDLPAEHRQEQSSEQSSQPENSGNPESGHDDDLDHYEHKPEHDQGKIFPPGQTSQKMTPEKEGQQAQPGQAADPESLDKEVGNEDEHSGGYQQR